MEFETFLRAADLLGTFVLFILVLRQQENIVNILSPFVKEVVLGILESNDKRWEETSDMIKKCIDREKREHHGPREDSYYG